MFTIGQKVHIKGMEYEYEVVDIQIPMIILRDWANELVVVREECVKLL